MTQIILAKSPIGKEFLYSLESARKVSNASAVNIMNIVNEHKYQLKTGEIWALHIVDKYDDAFYTNRAFRIRKGIVTDCYC